MVLTRAFACATPVVASDISGYRGVMEPEAGRLVPPGDPAALVEAVVALLGDELVREQLGRSARVIAVERYSWDMIAQRLVEIYEPLTAPRRAEAA
jgi:glycosyltransferase involved in cell wall biosynthesis